MDGIETESEGIQTDEEFQENKPPPIDDEDTLDNENDISISEKLEKIPVKSAEDQLTEQSAETSPVEIENETENETENDSSLLKTKEISSDEAENEMHTEEIENLIQSSSGFEPLMETIQEIDSDNVPDLIPDSPETDSKPGSDTECSKIENETLAEDVTYAEIQADSDQATKTNPGDEPTDEQEPCKVENTEAETVVDQVTEQESSSLTQKLMNFIGFSDDVKLNITPPNSKSEIEPQIITVAEEITYREVTKQEANLLESILESQSHR